MKSFILFYLVAMAMASSPPMRIADYLRQRYSTTGSGSNRLVDVEQDDTRIRGRDQPEHEFRDDKYPETAPNSVEQNDTRLSSEVQTRNGNRKDPGTAFIILVRPDGSISIITYVKDEEDDLNLPGSIFSTNIAMNLG